ncbi:hypothetical protein [Streptomyces sp. NPDC017940]|uniref:hypothetical protein n=1 Tax=Streptomyces sp. NPDC017940 TaxID=3365017 RepID=UPI00379CFBA2
MTIPAYSEVDAEYHRASQIGAARAVERLLRLPHLPPVQSWTIEQESGTVRGHLALPEWSRSAAVAAVRGVHRAFGGTVRLRRGPYGARELGARFDCHLWPVELWIHTAKPDPLSAERELRELRQQLARTDKYLAALGWFNDGEATMRRHTASGWWELASGYTGSPGEWLLFGPDGCPFGAFMSARSKLKARANADAYISERESNQA